MFISVCGSRTTLWKSQKYYMVWILFYFWSLGLTTVSLLLSFSTLFFRHNSRHYVIFQLQINYLTGLPFVLSPSDPCNFERLSQIHSCMFFPYYNSSNLHEKNSQFWLATSNAIFFEIQCQETKYRAKKKYSANKIIFLTFKFFIFQIS
jgi:hypothetical protein